MVTDTLEKVGLQGNVSESETSSQTQGHIHYVIRSEAEHYGDTENSLFIADISSANYKGERVLFTIFNQSVAADQIEWEDWKEQIVFATLLYGGFENEEDVYQAFLEKELPRGETSFVWDAQLPEGYCTVSYNCGSNTTFDKDGFAVQKRSALMRVNIYESLELYQELKGKRESEQLA